jgi:hypothetical protein
MDQLRENQVTLSTGCIIYDTWRHAAAEVTISLTIMNIMRRNANRPWNTCEKPGQAVKRWCYLRQESSSEDELNLDQANVIFTSSELFIAAGQRTFLLGGID